MLDLVRYNVLTALRNSSLSIWVLAFPLILSTLFMVMFSNMSSGASATNIAVGLVADGNLNDAPGLGELLDELSHERDGEDPLLSLTSYGSVSEAERDLLDGDVEAFVTVGGDGVPVMHVHPYQGASSRVSIVQTVLDRYVEQSATVSVLAARDASFAADPAAISRLVEDLAGDEAGTETLPVLRVDPSEFARYYYAMLGFSSIMASNVAALLVERVRANLAPVGVHFQVSAAHPVKQVAAAFLASWLIGFCALMAASVYAGAVAGVSFGGREALLPLACAACSLMACAIGATAGSIPWISLNAKDALLSVLTLVLSLPTGLFGEPALEFSNWMEAHLPALQAANPAVQASNAFYSLAYYDSLAPFAQTLGAIAVIAAALFAAAALFMRRQRYAHL